VKELGAIALPTFKNWGRDSFAPFLALNLRKKMCFFSMEAYIVPCVITSINILI
jgi:hypothetical protein